MKHFEFLDRDGVTWRVVWRSRTARTRVVNGDDGERPGLAGFEFTCSALTFHVPWPAYTDPRALRRAVLQRMVDRALGG